MRLELFNTRDRRVQTIVRRLQKDLERDLGRPGRISIVLSGDRLVRELNRRFLDRDRPTDVLAFPTEARSSKFLGEVYVCRDQARRQARDYEVEYYDEISRLVLHGVLHLLGLTHRQMEPYYQRYLSRKSDVQSRRSKVRERP